MTVLELIEQLERLVSEDAAGDCEVLTCDSKLSVLNTWLLKSIEFPQICVPVVTKHGLAFPREIPDEPFPRETPIADGSVVVLYSGLLGE
jgi:hypothetical protein